MNNTTFWLCFYRLTKKKLLLYVFLPNNPIHHKHIFINKREKKRSKHEPLLWLAHRTLLVKSEDAVKHINRIDFLFHDHIGIDFRGVDVGMPQHLTCGVDVTSCCQDEGGEGVTGKMGTH